MQVVDSISALRTARQALHGSVGVILTMGALHAGHISLVQAAKTENDHVIVTIFLNPLQFAATEDLSKYPRDLVGDLSKLEAAGVDLVFTPTPAVMYPHGFQTNVIVKNVTQGLEGGRRPGHFEGVTTVVAKLFNLTQPNKTYFGQKDAQQVIVIKRMCRDLNFPFDVVVCPTTRETSGLAMSSRNVYLTPDQRVNAGSISQGLRAAAQVYDAGERDAAKLIKAVTDALTPDLQVEYVSINDPHTLETVTQADEKPLLLSLAVRASTTRLIDNCLLPYHLNNRADLSQILGG